MELLIPGLVLVALMVYASTKIKKSAEKAFEAEQIETPGFCISKPEGFLSRIDPQPPLVFEAYSKAFGEKPFENVRMVTAEIAANGDTDVVSAARKLRASVGKATSERSSRDIRLLEADEVRDDAEAKGFYKIVKSSGGVLCLHISALKEPTADVQLKIGEMLETFTGK